MTRRDTDEIGQEYGVDALGWTGEQVAEVDGVEVMRQVVEAMEATEDKTARLGHLTALYSDSGRRAAVVQALQHRPGELEGVLLRLANLPSMGGHVNRLRTTLKAEARNLRIVDGPTDMGPAEIRAVIDWGDYPAGIVVPPGWKLVDRTNLFRLTQDGERPVGTPVLLTRCLVDADSRKWHAELAWWDAGKDRWKTQIVPKSVALDARSLVMLIDDGVPASSTTSRYIVAWLTALDQQGSMPVDWCSARMGWVGRKDRYFLLGRRVLRSGDTTHRVDLTAAGGGEQLASACRTVGTWEGWLETVALVSAYPAAWAAIYAAASAPLLRLLNAPNFGLDFVGLSGTGKSTALRLGTSVVGDPHDGAYMRSWNASDAGMESNAAMLCDVPLCLDEGQLVSPDQYGKAGAWLYALINGIGKTRGSIGRLGQQRVESWRTVLLSTSEIGITRWNPHDGARARVLELRGHPLGENNADLSEDVEQRLYQHYGHLMPKLVRWLLDQTPEQRAWLVAEYKRRKAELGASAWSAMGRRAAQYVATMEAAAMILHTQLGVPEPEADVMGWIWAKVQSVCADADQPRAALDVAWPWCESLRENFVDGKLDENGDPLPARQPTQGWLGQWMHGLRQVAVLPQHLDAVLQRAGHPEPRAIYREWARRGWTDSDKGYSTKRLRWKGSGREGPRSRFIVLRLDAVESLDSDGAPK